MNEWINVSSTKKMMTNLITAKSTRTIPLCFLFSATTYAQEDVEQQELTQLSGVSHWGTNEAGSGSLVYPHLFVGAKTGVQLSTLEDTSEEIAFGALAGMQYTEHWSWDIGYQYHGNSETPIRSNEISLFDTAIRYDWYVTQDVSVYGKLGAAYWRINVNEGYKGSVDENGVSPLAEIGLNYRLTPNVYLNAGYQYIDEVGGDWSGRYDSRTLMAGVSYHFKGQPKPVAQPATPITPARITVTPKTEIAPDITPALEPQIVTTLFETTVLANVAFTFNSDEFTEHPSITSKIDQFVDLLNQHTHAQGVIVGHTDSIGTEQYNKLLSERRARSVLRAVVQKGADVDRLRIDARGESHPIATNSNASGRVKNRRVELIILSFSYEKEKQ